MKLRPARIEGTEQFSLLSESGEPVVAVLLTGSEGEKLVRRLAANEDLYGACENALEAIRKNLAYYAFKDETALYEAFRLIESALAKARGEA